MPPVIPQDDTNLTNGTPTLLLRERMVDKHERYNPLEDLVPLTVWDEENPHSVIRLVTEEFRKLMLALPDDAKAGDEQAKKDALKPSATMRQLKILFWTEYNRVIMHGEKRMIMKFVYGPAIDERYWAQLRNNQNFLAWLITPPPNHTVRLVELLELSFDKMRSFLECDPMNKNGTPNVKLMELQHKIGMYLDARVNGSIESRVRVESKNTTLNANVAIEHRNASPAVSKALAEGDMDQLTAELKRLEGLEDNRLSHERARLQKNLAKNAASTESLDSAIEAHFSEIVIPEMQTPPSMEASESRMANSAAPDLQPSALDLGLQGEAGGR